MIKTRFAPSPTGYLHIGGLRTALYAYLFAKKNQGKFIMRIEDTDQKRLVEDAVGKLVETLNWAGIHYDEGPNADQSSFGPNGPYIQSQRLPFYQENVQKLLKSGHAYYCFCTKERLEEMRENQKKNNLPPIYDRKCLNLPLKEIEEKIQNNEQFVIRQKIPYTAIKFKDIIRGNVQFHGKTIDDQVLMKSDGFPTYHLANVVDDHFMEITHVIRAEEWLPSTPKHIALYEAFGWTAPQFAHLPLIINSDRAKLSKRHGDVSVESYINKGYEKEAILNFVAFLGWNPGKGEEREIFTLSELEQIFELDKVHKSAAIFNIEKLNWFNWRWKKEKLNQKLIKTANDIDKNVAQTTNQKGQLQFTFSTKELSEKYLIEKGKILIESVKDEIPEAYKKHTDLLNRAIITIEEKVLKEPKNTAENLKCFFEELPVTNELLIREKMNIDLELAKKAITATKDTLENLNQWTENDIKDVLMDLIQKLELKNGQLLWPVRACLTGIEFSPGAFEVAWALGKQETLSRLEKTIKKL